MELVIATHNLHKVRELRSMLKHLRLDLRSLHDFPNYKAPEETGATFEENALLKAMHAAKTLNKWAFSDDSGLVVPSIQGAPGVLSARYAGPGATDKSNREKLLKVLEGKKGFDRTAYFECCIALASPQGASKVFKGICEGTIPIEEMGKNGFGYDSLFIKQEYNQTFAELGEVTKNRISHRRRAVDKLALYLEAHVLH